MSLSNLALLAIVKNEKPEYLQEWRAHYEGLGCKFTVLLDHQPNNIPIPSMPKTDVFVVPPNRSQHIYYKDALSRITARWVIVVDVDEFIVCNDLPKLLADVASNAEALAINWLVFGTSGHREPMFPVHGSYHCHLPTTHGMNRHIKSIVRPESIKRVPQTPHYFHVRTVNELGQLVTGPFHDHSSTVARINHYYTRSLRDWKEKVARGRADGPWKRDINEVEYIDRESTSCILNGKLI